MNDDATDLPEDDNDITPTVLNLDLIKASFPKYTTEKVAEMVVVCRYLGLDNAITVACMQELADRRDRGDTFVFESFIEEQAKKLPVISLKLPDLKTMLEKMTKKGFGGSR